MKRFLYDPAWPGTTRTLFDSIVDIDNLRIAHHQASRGKRWYPEVKMVNEDPDYYLYMIRDLLINHKYKTSEYRVFEKKENDKVRKIYSLPYFPDRIVQWAIIRVIGPILENHFIYDTYSSIKGKGPLLCANRVYKALHYHSEETKACLQTDIHHFYPSINQEILKEKYKRLFKDPNLLILLFDIIDSLPVDEGVPIGNYLSQYSGNLYLTDFDHYIKEQTDVKYYYRYMDDMVFLHDDFYYLKDLLGKIKTMLKESCKLNIKDKYQLFYTCDRGVDFCGYVINHEYIKIRNRTRNRYIDKCKLYKDEQMTEHNRESFNSYNGFLEHANTYNLQNKYGSLVYKNWHGDIENNIKTRRDNR